VRAVVDSDLRVPRHPRTPRKDGATTRPLAALMPMRAMDVGEDLFQAAIAVILFVIAGFVLFRTVDQLISTRPLFPHGVILGINNVLFVVIILEILRTVTSHFTGGGLRIKPFLIIGVISAVRHILTVSASLTLEGDGSETHFRHSLIELGVNSGVVLALVAGLVLIGLNDRQAANPPSSP
jgi:uncharacterized membrane protein (DUF373 family)